MYINLGNIELHKKSNTVHDDWMILSEVVSSKMSYEKPIMVRSVDELEALFGKEFSSYSYLAEFLLMRNTLYLYKPISPNSCITDSYIDYDNFEDFTDLFITRGDVDVLECLKNYPDSYVIKVVDDNGKNPVFYKYARIQEEFKVCKNPDEYKIIDETFTKDRLVVFKKVLCRKGLKRKFKIANDTTISIWNKDTSSGSSYYDLIDVNYLPQNINKISESLNNRDTLLITRPESTIPYTYPKYDNGILNVASSCSKRVNIDSDYNCYVDLEKIKEKLQSFVVDIDYATEELNGENGGYIVVPIPITNKETKELKYDYQVFYYGPENKVDEITKDIDSCYKKRTPIHFKNAKTEFLGALSDYGYVIEKNYENSYKIYSSVVIPIKNFYNSAVLYIRPDIETTEDLLTKNIFEDESNIGVEFWSKTIGRGSLINDDDFIKVKIEKIEDNKYRFSVNRYGYSEVFEGSTKPSIGEERLDYTITKNSKLLYCTFKNINSGLREGEYILQGATTEEYNQEMYLYSLDKIFSEEIYMDFFLVPDKYRYIKEESRDTSYFGEYELFLNYAKSKQCQFLIENIRSPFTKEEVYVVEPSDNPNEASESLSKVPSIGEDEVLYKVIFNPKEGVTDYKEPQTLLRGKVNGKTTYIVDKILLTTIENNGDFVYNYVKDDNNYLLYFYKDMKLGDGSYRPGFYMFLSNILLNEFGESDKRILYEDFAKCAYVKEDFENILEKYKSNYLSYNNHMYYYKKYFSGNKPNTTIWMRFVLGKIYRELEKNKGKLLETNYVGKTKNVLTSLMKKIENRFEIVKCINITKFDISLQTNSISVGLETYVNDLVDNDIKIDITINYNNKI